MPNEPDCDYNRGEEPLSEEKIKHLAHNFLKYGVMEKRHEILRTKQKVGHVVESYLLPGPASIKGLDGKTRQYPKGTWIVTAEITDEQTIAETRKGVYTGFSATTIPRGVADNISFKSSQGQLIKDIPDPVVFAVSLVEKPCVHSAKFCKVKHSQNEELDMNEEDKQFLNRLREAFSFKGNNPETDALTELKEEFASLKSEFSNFRSELIEGVAQGTTQAIKEAFSDPKKKDDDEGDPKKNNTNKNDDGDDGDNNTKDNNGEGNSNTDEGDDEGSTTKTNNGEGDGVNKKKKKPPVSSKGNKLHDGPQEVSHKSDTQIVYEIMGRNNRGQRIKE